MRRGTPPTERDHARLAALRLDHLRVELSLSSGGLPIRLARAAEDARATGAALDAALFLGECRDDDLRTLRDELSRTRAPVARWWLLRGPAEPAGDDDLRRARAVLGAHDPASRFGLGTDVHFVQWNRLRPPWTRSTSPSTRSPRRPMPSTTHRWSRRSTASSRRPGPPPDWPAVGRSSSGRSP
ncbi:MAG: hypothetical protein WKF75_17985 [Singulisphaera sp.]